MQGRPDAELEPGTRLPAVIRKPNSALVIRDRLVGVAEQVWHWRWHAVAALLAVLFARYLMLPALLGPVVSVEAVTRAEFVQSVVASGHVEAPFRVNVGSQITGTVVDVPVSEGQSVKIGDVLVVLDDREAKAAVTQAESAVAQSEARVRQMKELSLPAAEEALKQTRATLTNAQATYDRIKQLATGGVATRAALDDATKALDIARAQVRNAELQVYTSQPGGSDYTMAETLLAQARANLVTAQSKLGYTTIKAPREGVLISRNVERGNVVQASNVLMVLSPAGATQLVVQIDEKNLGLIVVGQKALASADAFPSQTFAAVIDYINPGIDLQRASVQVKLRVPEPPAYLRQDMTVSVDIETARKPGAVVAPLSAIRGQPSAGSAWVLKAERRRASRQSVKVGLVGGGKAEILDGLQPGDEIVPITATAIKDGSRLRPRIETRPQP